MVVSECKLYLNSWLPEMRAGTVNLIPSLHPTLAIELAQRIGKLKTEIPVVRRARIRTDQYLSMKVK